MIRGCRLALLTLATVGCGPGTYEPAALAGRCGDAAPIQLLSLSSREYVRAEPGAVTRWDGGWLFGVTELEGDVPEGLGVIRLPDDTFPRTVSNRVVATGPCGEDPQVVVNGGSWIFPPLADGDPWLACGDQNSLLVFDPTGRDEAQLLEGASCDFAVFEGTVVSVTPFAPTPPNLLRFDRGPDGSWSSEVLESGAGGWQSRGLCPWSHAPAGDDFVFIDASGELIRRAVHGDTRETIATGVEVVRFSCDFEWVAWSTDGRTGPAAPAGTWYLRWPDGSIQEIGPDGQPASEPFVRSSTITIESETPVDSRKTQIIFKADRRSVTLDGAWSPVAERSDGSLFLLNDEPGVAGYYVLPTWEPWPLRITRLVGTAWLDGGVLWIAEGTFPGTDLPPPEGFSQDVIRFVDDHTPQPVVSDVVYPLQAKGRWLTVRDHADDYHGNLVALDPDGTPRLVDRDVFVLFSEYDRSLDGPPRFPAVTDGPFVYPVRDPHGKRTGVWLAELAD